MKSWKYYLIVRCFTEELRFLEFETLYFHFLVWEVKFHALYPDNVFTCSEDGSAWYWDGTSIPTTTATRMNTTVREGMLPLPNMDSTQSEIQQTASPWLLMDTNKDMLETYSLLPVNNLPVNSIDITAKSLICGTDGEAIIILRDLPLK